MTTLRTAVQEYLTLRRGLGFHLRDTGRLLLKFVTFMEEHRASIVTTPLALMWAQHSQTVQPAERARRLSIVRIFARYRHATDPRTEIPPDGLLPDRPRRARPYLYSDAEIRHLLRAARTLPARGGFRPWAYHGLFGLLSVAGLRLGEARNLRVDDVDLDARRAHHPRREIRQVSPRAAARVQLQDPGGLSRATATPLGGTTRLALPLRVQLGQPARCRERPSHVLRALPPDRTAEAWGLPWPADS